MTGMNDQSPRPGIHPAKGPSTLGSAWAIGLSIAMVIVGLLGAANMYFAPLGVSGCSGGCDFDLLNTAINTYFTITPIVVIAALIGVAVLFRRGRRVIIPAALGLALVVGLCVWSHVAATIALDL